MGFMQILNDIEHEKCRTSAGLFEVLSEKFKAQYNETLMSLQPCRLTGEQNENAEERWADYDSKPMNVVTKKEAEGSRNDS